MAQVRNVQDITITDWWESVYPYAVILETNITTSPLEMDYQAVKTAQENLPEVLLKVREIPYPGSAAVIREHLIRAITYLLHAFQVLDKNYDHETDFYYSSALTQCAQLHHQLVKQGFAN